VSRIIFKLPDIGEGVVEGEVVAWHVEPGTRVEEDQPLVDVMTDKATVTIPSTVGGRVVSTRGKVGETVAVGSELVVIETDGDAAPQQEPAVVEARAEQVKEEGAASTGYPANAGPPPVEVKRGGPTPRQPRPLASPAVRRRAREQGVDLNEIVGTGRGGRITDRDIEEYRRAAAAPAANGHSRAKRTGTSEIHISGLRRSIARKMSVSNTHIPHFSYFEQVDITELAELRKHLNNHRAADDPKLTYLPFIMLALVKAFRRHPESNAHYDDAREVVTRFEAVHLGIATQTERGLYVPVVKHVETMDLWEAARELRRVTQAAHHNTIKRDELTGSTFTVTSLGLLGGLAATPIINHPEVGILGVHRAYDRPVVQNGQVVVRHLVNLSSSFDHRVVDGADGAALVQTLKSMLEHPALIFL
jgi:2-oxoisovalerate dehydrogenase E2 component (dihydrolipoyl transacylase)